VLITITVLTLLSSIATPAEHQHDAIVLENENGAVHFSTNNGSIAVLRQKGQPDSILRSGEEGLWLVRFADGSQISAADFDSSSTEQIFQCVSDPQTGALKMKFQSTEIKVVIAVAPGIDGVEFTGEITPQSKTILDFALPARLRFKPEQLDRFICPMDGNRSVGTAFKSAFFQRQSHKEPTAWQPGPAAGPKGYISLFGSPLEQRDDSEASTTLHITPAGREWFGSRIADRLEGSKALVNRPSPRRHTDLILVDSPQGPYFAASHLGGQGALWRIGGRIDNPEKLNARLMIMAAIRKLMASSTEDRRRLGLVALDRGPEKGSWTAIKVDEWLQAFQLMSAAANREDHVEKLTTVEAMMDALKSEKFLAILNPYGEWIPTPDEGGMDATIEAIREYVKTGGHWFEAGGYPFYYALQPARYFSYNTSYPAAFADFFHLDTQVGSASIYRVQPRQHAPWEGANNPELIFVPGRLACGGDEQGGYCDRAFATYVPAGETWRSPRVRLVMGRSAVEDLRTYCEANMINRSLEDKMPAETLEKLKNSVMVYYAGNCREKLEHLELLPVPSQIHFADYLKGGFDKQYPDHLPPHPNFGTPEELRNFFDRCRELGHLVMPYTNPTWWCDGPKGPTFEREGEAPLLRNLDGSLSRERYAANEGYTICHWHPAVQAANRKTLRQFSKDFPVGILLQDQCGARRWRYDMNPASPTPYAYTEGLLSMIAEDCKTKPLSTESGWDQVVNYESQLCGMSWSIVPTEGGPQWRTLMKYQYPPETWEIFPLAQHIAHDKVAMLYHDLGQFVTNREVLAWTLGLGFCMSYRVRAETLKQDTRREWLKWLDRIQKSVCSRYVGKSIHSFEHDRSSATDLQDDGIMRATYGSVEIVANLGPEVRIEGHRELAPHGFYAAAPGMIAASLSRSGEIDFGDDGISFVVEMEAQRMDVWVYAHSGSEVCIELPDSRQGNMLLVFDDDSEIQSAVKDGVLRFRLSGKAGRIKYLWHAISHQN